VHEYGSTWENLVKPGSGGGLAQSEEIGMGVLVARSMKEHPTKVNLGATKKNRLRTERNQISDQPYTCINRVLRRSTLAGLTCTRGDRAKRPESPSCLKGEPKKG